MRKSTPYDEDGTCPYCGGSLYLNDDGKLECEDCGETTSPGPDPDRQLEDLIEDRRLRQEYPDPPDEG